jgi:hypothetical protein
MKGKRDWKEIPAASGFNQRRIFLAANPTARIATSGNGPDFVGKGVDFCVSGDDPSRQHQCS